MNYAPDEVPDEAVDALRPAFEHCLDLTSAQCVAAARAGRVRIWRKSFLWMVTAEHATRIGVVVQIIAAAGPWDGDLLDEIESYARNIGAKQLKYSGRRGWERKVPNFKVTSITATKEL